MSLDKIREAIAAGDKLACEAEKKRVAEEWARRETEHKSYQDAVNRWHEKLLKDDWIFKQIQEAAAKGYDAITIDAHSPEGAQQAADAVRRIEGLSPQVRSSTYTMGDFAESCLVTEWWVQVRFRTDKNSSW